MGQLSIQLCEEQSNMTPNRHVMRDRLISTMLQDRNVLRIVSAPHGFGKTELVLEYAERLFPEGNIVYVQGNSPDFLLSLDKGSDEFLQLTQNTNLLIIDDLSWLHEERAEALSHMIEKALYKGIEVIVAVLPSCNCLTLVQPDHLAIHAEDLLVFEQEHASRFSSTMDADERAIGKKRWVDAARLLFGHVPMVVWGKGDDQQAACLNGLFSEQLPLQILRNMVAMFFLGEGTFDDLGRAGVQVHADDISLLTQDYPLFGIDPMLKRFSVGEFQFEDLHAAISSNRLDSIVFNSGTSLIEKALSVLFAKGDIVRASQIITVFCSDEQCANWLIERGWSFLDAGKIPLVSHLFNRCPEDMYAENRELQAMHAWLSGFSGDKREACHIASRLLASSPDGNDLDVPGLAASLALDMFDKDAISSERKRAFSAQDGPMDAMDFLACVVGECSTVEIVRSLCLGMGSSDARLEKARCVPSKHRTRKLTNMFTEYAERFKDTASFKLALHILAHVDSVPLRKLVQELGCDAIVEMRRCGVDTFSSALLVRDMWNVGYFGLKGPVIDRRDAKILDGAANMLNELAYCIGSAHAYVPWEDRRKSKKATQNNTKAIPSAKKANIMRINLFGGFEAVIGDRYIAESNWSKKGRALIAILVLNHGRDIPRSEILEQIWPDTPRVNALDSFYSLWSRCSSVLGENIYIEKSGEFCRADPRFVHSDTAEFEQLSRLLINADKDPMHILDIYARLEALYQGSLMPSETNVRLICAQRERYRSLFVDAMVSASGLALDVDDIRVSLWFAHKAFDEDQEREDVYRALMKAQIAAGQRCQAIKTYFLCRDFLRETYGLDPSYETRELYNALITTDPELLRFNEATLLHS